MSRAASSVSSADSDMAVRAAWMHFAGGYTQAEVAEKLGLSRLKAHRLITRANREGMVKVYVDGDVSECLQLESELSNRFELDYCEVVPDFDNEALPLQALGIAGGQYIHRLLDGAEVRSVGIGHGRTLASCVEHIPRTRNARLGSDRTGKSCSIKSRSDKPRSDRSRSDKSGIEFVSLLGGFSEKFAANPHDVIHRLAERTGAQAYVMPVPFLANTIEDRDVLMEQRGLKQVIGKARNTPLKIVGIGAVAHDSSLVATGWVDESEFTAISAAGGVGELLGHFFTADGNPTYTELSERTMGLSLEDLRCSRIVAIAGGTSKSAAITAVLKSQLLGGLITDERTARMLV